MQKKSNSTQKTSCHKLYTKATTTKLNDMLISTRFEMVPDTDYTILKERSWTVFCIHFHSVNVFK